MNDRQERFVGCYVANGGNATQAYIAAGYSENGAGQSAEKLLKNPEVAAAVAGGRNRVAQMTEINQQWVLDGLRTVAARALEHRQYGSAARSYELIGKHLGMFSDRLIIEDLRKRAAAAAEEYDLDADEVQREAERWLAAKK